MIEIDGSLCEGGGQVLRSTLTLSLLTGQPVRIANIRARRYRPGLEPQHLMAVQAAAAVSGAHVEGARQGSTSLAFHPGAIRAGRYEFNIGTAGSTSLVLQTIFLPLSLADGASSITLIGGTHVPWSPSFHYLDLQWLPCLREMGFDARLSLDWAGFYPKGGGRVHAAIRPVHILNPLHLTERGTLMRVYGVSVVANQEVSVAERQREQAIRRLRTLHARAHVDVVQLPALSRGSALVVLAEFERGRCCYQTLGERRRSAERVADDTVSAMDGFLVSDGAVDEYLADQLLLPLVLAPGSSEVCTSKVTSHLLTNAEIIRKFLPVNIEIQGEVGRPGLIRVIS